MNGRDSELALSLEREHAGRKPQHCTIRPGLRLQSILLTAGPPEERPAHAHPEELSDAGYQGQAGCWRGAKKMMSESLSCCPGDQQLGQTLPDKDSQVVFPTPEPRCPMALPPALSQDWTVGTAVTAEADKSSPHLMERYLSLNSKGKTANERKVTGKQLVLFRRKNQGL